jgi:membrane protein required for colicin V production
MSWVDALVLLVLACSALFAFLRGFVREALGICAWAGAIYVAIALFGAARPEARHLISNPEVADPVAFGVVFLVALIVFSVIAGIISRMVRGSGLGGLDRTIGLLFGIVRGAALVCLAYIGTGWVFPVAQWPDVVLRARSLPYAYAGAQWIVAQVPREYAPRLAEPPEVPPAQLGELLQPAPHGTALGGHEQADRESR